VIFVTIGSMFPFDRLIRVMDDWTARSGRKDVLAQIGNGGYVPQHMEHVRRLFQADFSARVAGADVIVAHAGMGTVITAGRAGKPIVIMPRIEAWGEHTTDHQIATANWLREKPGIFVADTDADLPGAIEAALASGGSGSAKFSPVADAVFTDRIRMTIQGFLE
jgi:UDP-N-acetylglucosamine transferase subunit ALG13